MRHRVVFSPDARADVLALYDYIAAQSSPDRAIRYIDRIERFCLNLAAFPQRGARRDDLRPGLRMIGFENRAVIAFDLQADTVMILRILYGGRNFEIAF